MDIKEQYSRYLERLNHEIDKGNIERSEVKVLTYEEYIIEFGRMYDEN